MKEKTIAKRVSTKKRAKLRGGLARLRRPIGNSLTQPGPTADDGSPIGKFACTCKVSPCSCDAIKPHEVL